MITILVQSQHAIHPLVALWFIKANTTGEARKGGKEVTCLTWLVGASAASVGSNNGGTGTSIVTAMPSPAFAFSLLKHVRLASDR